ncbi:MAG: radical SAM protein [Oscillospiraceae bacterium]|nr:radical SAM protein [Oscillospiraceae bacterium]
MEYIPAKTIISAYGENSSWFGTNYNMNIYKGCCHGCIYCDSRSDCYHIERFDTVRAKANALEIIRNDLRRKVKTGVVGTGAMSDPYNPFERELKLTRNALELINAYGFGAAIATKSNLITRDIDVLKDIASHSPVLCKITVTAADDDLCAITEPNVCRTGARFDAIRRLSDAGLYTGVLLMPVLPFITDNPENIISIVRMAHENGAKFVYAAMGMTLRNNQRMHYYTKLDEAFPGLKQKYMQTYADTYSCGAPKAARLWAIFAKTCEQYGLLYRMQDIISGYKQGYKNTQLSFL